jgi:hypothetical protein
LSRDILMIWRLWTIYSMNCPIIDWDWGEEWQTQNEICAGAPVCL